MFMTNNLFIKSMFYAICLLFCSCTSVNKGSSAELNKTMFAYYDNALLSDVIAEIDSEVTYQVKVGKRLDKVADLIVSRLPSNVSLSGDFLEDQFEVRVGELLSYICNYIRSVHGVDIGCVKDGNIITIIYIGTDKRYLELKKKSA